jgi:DNA-binding transcriptional LysR family regulator
VELRQLTIFQAVAKTLSFTRAAEHLSYSQSNVTSQVQALEHEFGTPLFERLGRRVVLTEAGTRFLPYAERLIQLAAEARSAMTEGAEPGGSLMIGACEVLCTYRLPAVLQSFRKRFPNVKLAIDSTHCSDLPAKLSRGAIDMAFIFDRYELTDEFEHEELATEPLTLVVPADHRLSSQGSIPLRALDGERLLVNQPGCGHREFLEDALARSGTRVDLPLEFNSDEAIKQCVRSGIGVAFLPLLTVRDELEAGTLVALDVIGLEVSMPLRVAWHKHKWHSPAFDAFVALAKERLRRPADTSPDALAS